MIVCVKFDDGRKPASFEKATGYWIQESASLKMIRVTELGPRGFEQVTEIPFEKIESVTVVYGS